MSGELMVESVNGREAAIPSRRHLGSWKEIAAYIGRDVRTVLRWHKHRGLPIHRVPGGKKGSVFAYPDELDTWMLGDGPSAERASPPAQRRRYRWPIWSGIAALAVLAGLAGITGGVRRGPLVTVVLRHGQLVGVDAEQRELWALKLPDVQQALLSGMHAIQREDLDGDGRREILASVHLQPGPRSAPREVLYCLNEEGRVRWSLSLDDRLSFNSGEYGPPWVTGDLIVFGEASDRRVAWATHHGTWWPAIVAILDAAGTVRHRFVNAGWITSLAATRDGRHLIAAGVNNARDASALAVLDARNPAGTSPEPPGSPYACRACPQGAPLRYFLFPRSELNRLSDRVSLEQSVALSDDGSIVMREPQDPAHKAAEAIYELSAAFNLRRASLGDIYWDWHRRVEADRKIHHTAEACPERSGLTVSSWDAENGWRTWRAPTAANPAPASR